MAYHSIGRSNSEFDTEFPNCGPVATIDNLITHEFVDLSLSFCGVPRFGRGFRYGQLVDSGLTQVSERPDSICRSGRLNGYVND